MVNTKRTAAAKEGTANQGTMEMRAMTKVRPEEKKSTASLTLIWAGGVISAPALMVGAILMGGLSLKMILLITLIAFGAQVALMSLNGIEASDTGYPLTVLLGKTFGNIGSRYILAALITVTQALQAAVQVGVCAGAFVASLAKFGIPFPLWLSIILWGGIMVLTAVYGFKWMTVLSYIAVPFLIISCLYATIRAIGMYGGFSAIMTYRPAQQMDFVSALAIMIGIFACGTIVCTDLTRYSKSRRSTIISSVLGILPATLLMIVMGAIMSVGAGTTELTELFVKLDMPVIGVMALLLATWTTNTTNFYQSGLAFTRFCGVQDSKRPLLTAIVGGVATLMAVFGMLDFFVPMLNGFSIMIPPIAGIMVADYWIIGKGKKEHWGIMPGFNFVGIGAWIAGMLVGFTVDVFSPAFNSIIVGMAAYLILYAVFRNKMPEAENPEVFIGE